MYLVICGASDISTYVIFEIKSNATYLNSPLFVSSQENVLTLVWTALPYNDPTEQDGLAVTSVSGAWFESRPKHLLAWLRYLWFSALTG